MPGGNTRTTVFIDPFPIYAARGDGCRIWDVDAMSTTTASTTSLR